MPLGGAARVAEVAGEEVEAVAATGVEGGGEAAIELEETLVQVAMNGVVEVSSAGAGGEFEAVVEQGEDAAEAGREENEAAVGVRAAELVAILIALAVDDDASVQLQETPGAETVVEVENGAGGEVVGFPAGGREGDAGAGAEEVGGALGEGGEAEEKGEEKGAGDGCGIMEGLELHKSILKKVGEAVTRFKMIRDGDRVAVGFSGGKDSYTLLEALVKLRARAPVEFTVCAFTVDQGKFLAPVEPFREWLKERGVEWTLKVDNPSLRLLTEQPDHGCDVCSRFRRRAVYAIARELGANVIAFGHTADDFCESFLRNAMFTGQLSALPAVTYSRKRDFRLIRPLVYVTEEMTRGFAGETGAPVIPCGCSLKTGTVRRSIRDMFAEIEKEYPYLKSTLLTAMGNLKTSRLLDLRYLDLEGGPEEAEAGPLAVLDEPAFTES